MPYLPTAQSFLEQSILLTSARPTTTRISTKYNIPHPSPPPNPYKPTSTSPKKRSNPVSSPSTTPEPSSSQLRNLQPTLTLKTYDPVSGTCLKYRTDKAAEVGRLVASLGACGRVMAALPPKEEVKEDQKEVEVVDEEKVTDQVREGTSSMPAKSGQAQGKAGGGGGGGGKKKKSKR